MRTLSLSAVIAVLLLAVMLFAEQQRHDPQSLNKVAHPAGTMLAVNFAHADHVAQTCTTCHHNYVDTTGLGMCLDCHKTDSTVAHLIEEQFHDLCRDCHVQKQAEGVAHGPTRQCIACHVPDQQP